MSKKTEEELPLRTVSEYGKTFKTGQQVEFHYIRNTTSSKQFGNFGNMFQQDIEPVGRYMTHNYNPNREPPAGWEKGKVSFRKPLVIEWGEAYDKTSWKYILHKHYKKKGKALSRAIIQDGYDGIVTVRDKKETSEIVDLTELK